MISMNNGQKITVCAFLHHKGKLFIAKRAATKRFLPDKFELPGGHVEFGETLEDGLRREFREEFGVDIEIGDPFYAFTYINDGAHVVEIDYLAKLKDSNQVININPEDHSEYRWVSKKEVDEVWDDKDAEYGAIQKGFGIINKL